MNEDDPADVAHDQFAQALWGEHMLARPVLGTRASINAMTRDVIAGYWGRRYHPSTVVLAIAGHVEHDAAVAMAEKTFGSWSGEQVSHELAPTAIQPRIGVVRRDTEQAHLVIGGESLTRDDDRRFAFGILNHVVGGGMSSRLFRAIREERGLAYAVFAFRMPYADSGAYGVYVGTTPHQTEEVLGLIRSELASVSADGITGQELERAKGNMKGSLALSMEDTNSRMVRLGRHELTGVDHLTLDETVARIDAVTLDEVHSVARQVYGGPFVMGAVGPFSDGDLDRYVE